MKRKVLLSLLAVAMVLISLCGLIIGCNKKEKGEYSVTVLGVDEQPVKDIAVSWNAGGKSKGTATTDADGRAVANIELGTYEISLSNYEEGYTYPSVSVNSNMREVTIMLEVAKVIYTATVKDKTGAPAQGVKVSWRKPGNTGVAGEATTDAQGVASAELDYDDYRVYVSNIPSGNVFVGSLPASGASPSTEFNLLDGVEIPYSVTVKSEGGLKFADTYMSAYLGEDIVAFGQTDENGVYTFYLPEGEYVVDIDVIQDGYSKVTPVTKVTAQATSAEMVLKSAVIDRDPGNIKYVIGDIIHDYGFVTKKIVPAEDENGDPVYNESGQQVFEIVNDKEYSIGELLKTKKAIFINNWGTNCTWCVQEMPSMEEAYQLYKDDIEIIAVSNYNGGDTEEAIINFREEKGLTFPMMRDPHGFASKFSLTGFPATIVIDRYGAIARIESGAILEADVWTRLIEKYIGDDYVQTFVPGTHESESINNEIAKPDITVEEGHYDNVASVLNNFTADAEYSVEWHGETAYEYAWPFILNATAIEDIAEEPGTVLLASNGKRYVAGDTVESVTGKPNSIGIIYATVKMPAGKVFTFEYYSSSEPDDDQMSIVWDGKVVREISGDSKGWKTCYLYADLTSDTHSLGITYIKDRSQNVGEDNVFIRNVHFEDIADVDSTLKADNTSIDMLRGMAYGTPNEGDTIYPHYATMTLGDDGYYHVNKSSLQNNEFAGSEEAPMVYVNMLNPSNWESRYSIRELALGYDENGNYAVDCYFEVNGVRKDWRDTLSRYLYVASASDIYGFLPLDKELHDILVQFMAVWSGVNKHDNDILEACYFYSHYGVVDEADNKYMGNPIIGITDKTAIKLTGADLGNTITANLTKNIYPFPFAIYEFTAPEDGVYKIESTIAANEGDQYAGQISLYDNKTYNGEVADMNNPLVYCGSSHATLTGENERNFVVHRYMKAGEIYYLDISFQMTVTGNLPFKITNVGQSATALLPCSDNVYDAVLDVNGEPTGDVTLAGAVQYVYSDGYYYALQPDGSKSLIYLNVGYDSLAVYRTPMKDLVNAYVKDPANTSKDILDDENNKIKVFDFTKIVVYYPDANDPEILRYGISDTTLWNDTEFEIYADGPKEKNLFIDYSDRIQYYCDQAGRNGNPDGLVPMTQELMKILSLYLRVRNNALYLSSNSGSATITDWESVASNEWLRFCWYYRTYNSTNP